MTYFETPGVMGENSCMINLFLVVMCAEVSCILNIINLTFPTYQTIRVSYNQVYKSQTSIFGLYGNWCRVVDLIIKCLLFTTFNKCRLYHYIRIFSTFHIAVVSRLKYIRKNIFSFQKNWRCSKIDVVNMMLYWGLINRD